MTESHAPTIHSIQELVAYCKKKLRMVWVSGEHATQRPIGHLPLPNAKDISYLHFAAVHNHPTWQDLFMKIGLIEEPDRDARVTAKLKAELDLAVSDDRSELRWASTWPIERTFVFLDISDFSTAHPSGQQILVLNDLARLVQSPDLANELGGHAEAGEGPLESWLETSICVGDGYIFVCRETRGALLLAAKLAVLIEEKSARREIVPFSFRVGIHRGPVNCFWDIGRNAWNYMGEGSIGSRRVLEAIGKEVDNVIFLSDSVYQHLLSVEDHFSATDKIISAISNRGRRYDKHKLCWRVYELDHMKLCPRHRKQKAP